MRVLSFSLILAFIVRQLHRLTLPAKASLAFSILVGLLLMLSLSFFFFMKEEAKIELGNEGHDYADLDH